MPPACNNNGGCSRGEAWHGEKPKEVFDQSTINAMYGEAGNSSISTIKAVASQYNISVMMAARILGVISANGGETSICAEISMSLKPARRQKLLAPPSDGSSCASARRAAWGEPLQWRVENRLKLKRGTNAGWHGDINKKRSASSAWH